MITAGPDITDRLRDVLALAELPASAARQGEALLGRLERPVRVVVLGFPNSGQDRIINALAGAEVVPLGRTGPTHELYYSPVEKTTLVLADGTELHHTGRDSGPAFEQAALVRQGLPLENLRRTSLLWVAAEADHDEQRAAIGWAMKRTDIAIWCSQYFCADEQVLWQTVPDAVAYHSFLLLAGISADSADLPEFQDRLAGEFLRIIPGADGTSPARAAQTVMEHAALGQAADADSAHLFLKRFAADQVDPVAEAQPADAPVQLERPAGKEINGLSVGGARLEVESSTQLCAEVVTLLRTRASALLGGMRRADADIGPSEIVEHCAETLSTVSELMMAAEDLDDDATTWLADCVMEAEDLVTLLALEDGDGPAADAVSTLLQLRRDFELGLAA